MSPRNEAANQRIREERRFLILQAAAKVFARSGFTAAKVAEIAAEAGTSHGLVYHYFQSKERIFAALVEMMMQNGIETTVGALQQPGGLWEKISGMVETMVLSAQQGPEYYTLIHQAFTSEAVPESLRKRAWELARECMEALARVLAEGQAAGLVIEGDPVQLAMLLYSCVQGIAMVKVQAAHGRFKLADYHAQDVLRLVRRTGASVRAGKEG